MSIPLDEPDVQKVTVKKRIIYRMKKGCWEDMGRHGKRRHGEDMGTVLIKTWGRKTWAEDRKTWGRF
ncbi:MAG TPA: hypothetical protein PK728_10310 [Bacillota bacterium]|nr:hypothetical protein [Bacillota bacterium]